MSNWNKNLAQIWTKMVGPSRPTISELAIYQKHIRQLQLLSKHRLKMLVLGSTPEFRDLGYEENLDVTVMDCNPDYHEVINRELRHKEALSKEKILICNWQELAYEGEFDIIIGDLVIGNILPENLEVFIKSVAQALRQNGLFLGKSFYVDRNYTPLSPKQLCARYYNGYPYHPYSYFTYDLTIYVLNNNRLVFKKMYTELEHLIEENLLSSKTFEYFKNIGWDKEMKFEFFVPYIDDFESLVSKYFLISAVEYANEIYSKHFPLYILTK